MIWGPDGLLARRPKCRVAGHRTAAKPMPRSGRRAASGFVLEMGIAPDTALLNQGGRALGRQTFVGLAGPWGTVSFGRECSQILYSLFSDRRLHGPEHLLGGSARRLTRQRAFGQLHRLPRYLRRPYQWARASIRPHIARNALQVRDSLFHVEVIIVIGANLRVGIFHAPERVPSPSGLSGNHQPRGTRTVCSGISARMAVLSLTRKPRRPSAGSRRWTSWWNWGGDA